MDLDSAILYTNNISKIRKFYEHTIGLKFEYQDQEAFVSFIFPNGSKLGINKSILPDRERPGGQTVFIRVKDAKQQYEKYRDAGLACYEPYQEHDWGIYFAILDPDGNKVGFIEPPNPSRAVKYSESHTELINLGATKKIHKYPSPTNRLDIGRMVVNGRYPENGFVVEHNCEFVMYVTEGEGKFYVGEQIFQVKPRDVVFVPTDHRFAAEGNFEYITVDSPAFYPSQSEFVSGERTTGV